MSNNPARDIISGLASLALLGWYFGVFDQNDTRKSPIANIVSNITQMTGAAPQQPQPARPPSVFGLDNLGSIVAASRGNEANFDLSYKGHTFDAVMPFYGSHAAALGDGYFVDFGHNEVSCSDVTDQRTLTMVASWHKGVQARITGVMRSTTFGTLFLDKCRVVPA
jgi:hypothetical protein